MTANNRQKIDWLEVFKVSVQIVANWDAYSATDSAVPGLLQEAGKSEACHCPAFCFLQFLPRSQEPARHSCHGSWNHGSCVGAFGANSSLMLTDREVI